MWLELGASEDIEVVATASGGDAVETVRRERPDVVLLDIRMPDVDGLTVLRELRTIPDAPVAAMLTTFDADEYILTALNAGAAGLLLKDTEPEQLAHLVRTLVAGGVVLSPKASQLVGSSSDSLEPGSVQHGPSRAFTGLHGPSWAECAAALSPSRHRRKRFAPPQAGTGVQAEGSYSDSPAAMSRLLIASVMA
ncbi:response regulator transcription factor [Streptomyces sp. B21-079]|uniref:response regulator n=1 Tax=Streptomyces sp. B21-079 TaxID=3039409 RepID=UPI002FF42663